MSCSCYPNACLCNNGIEVPCADPGLVTSGRYLAVLDDQFCLKRTSNAGADGGFLTGTPAGFSFTNDPRVVLQTLEVPEGTTFDGFVVNLGSNGAYRKVIPAAGNNGALFAQNGKLVFQDPSSGGFVVPDPLTLTQLNVATLNATNATVSGTPTFTALNTDAITQTIGLNASNQLVKGTSATLSVAQFYESTSFNAGTTPNWTFPTTATSAVKINNEISDPDALASAPNDSTVTIAKAGSYTIEWYGYYMGYNPTGGNAGDFFLPGLWLYINNILTSKGNIEVYQDRNVGGPAFGKWSGSLAVGAQIQLRGNNSMRSSTGNNRGTGLQGVTLTLTKYK